ncbi:MAG TPA: TauD/TfdA family dioxygenase [Bordetella sp.]
MMMLASGPSVWRGVEMAQDPSWVWQLPASGVNTIERALESVMRRNIQVPEMRKEDFALPGLEENFHAIAGEVDTGRGFQVVRGVPVAGYSEDELHRLTWGLGLHFGVPVEQTKDADWLIDVRDEGGSYDRNSRGYHSASKLEFHTDGASIVGLLCVHKAEEGGLSVLVSAGAVHNELARTHPEHLIPLYDGFPVDRRGAQPPGEPRVSPWYLPVFSVTRGQLNCVYSRGACIWGREHLGQPCSEAEIAALDAFEAIASDPGFRLDMDLQPGDLQLVNNFTVLHSRTAFYDNPASPQRRHLVRLWLDVEGSDHAAINKLHLYTNKPLPSLVAVRPRT